MTILLFPIFFIMSMFLLYALSRNDFVLLRKNISLVEVFDKTLIAFIFSYIVGRIFYILDYKEFSFFHPLLFFHVLKTPGVSLLGCAIGITLILFFLFRKKKTLLRMFDIVALASTPLYMYGIIERFYPIQVWPYPFVDIILLIVLSFFLIFWHKTYYLKDGQVSVLLILFLAFDTLLIQNIGTEKMVAGFFSFTQVFSITLLAVLPILFFAIQRGMFGKKR